MKKFIKYFAPVLLIVSTIAAYISYRSDTVEVEIGCSVYNVKVTGTSVLRYKISSYNILGFNYTRFHVTNDDAPDLSFTTDPEGKNKRLIHLDYISAGTMDSYSVKC